MLVVVRCTDALAFCDVGVKFDMRHFTMRSFKLIFQPCIRFFYNYQTWVIRLHIWTKCVIKCFEESLVFIFMHRCGIPHISAFNILQFILQLVCQVTHIPKPRIF